MAPKRRVIGTDFGLGLVLRCTSKGTALYAPGRESQGAAVAQY